MIPKVLIYFFLHTLGVPARSYLTLAESINQDGLGRSNPRRVYSNLRHTLGPLGPQKEARPLSLAPISFPVIYPKITSW